MTASERNRWGLSRCSGARNCVQYIAAPAITVFPASRAQRKQKYMSITLRRLTKLALFSGTTGGVEFYGESIEEGRLHQKSGKDFVNFEIFDIKVWGRMKVFWRLKWRPWGTWRVQRREGALRLWFRNESNVLNTNTVKVLSLLSQSIRTFSNVELALWQLFSTSACRSVINFPLHMFELYCYGVKIFSKHKKYLCFYRNIAHSFLWHVVADS